jgi:hypothetical protein
LESSEPLEALAEPSEREAESIFEELEVVGRFDEPAPKAPPISSAPPFGPRREETPSVFASSAEETLVQPAPAWARAPQQPAAEDLTPAAETPSHEDEFFEEEYLLEEAHELGPPGLHTAQPVESEESDELSLSELGLESAYAAAPEAPVAAPAEMPVAAAEIGPSFAERLADSGAEAAEALGEAAAEAGVEWPEAPESAIEAPPFTAPAAAPIEEAQPPPAGEFEEELEAEAMAQPETAFAWPAPPVDSEPLEEAPPATAMAAAFEPLAPEPAIEVEPPPAPFAPAFAAAEVEAAPEPMAAAPAAADLERLMTSEEFIQRVAQRVVEQLSERLIENIAWEVVPDIAEREIRAAIAEITKEG